MLEAMVTENEIEISRRDIDFVRDLIAGIDRHPENEEKPYLFQIVANKQNGIDVDKYVTKPLCVSLHSMTN
jgi:deoxynucleoside triphosphate triphosphohydrolase SAMHD1